MNFTPELLNAALEKYVFRTKFTEKDKEYVLNQSDNVQNFDPRKTLENLIENSEGRLDIYEPADEWLTNLQNFTNFPNNSEFLGKCMNFEDTYRIYSDNRKRKFLLKCDVPIYLYKKLKSCKEDRISIILLEAYSHRFYRSLKNTLEYVTVDIVEKMYKESTQAADNWISSSANDINLNFVEYTPEEVYSMISKFYDGEIGQKLWEQLNITAENIQIRLNLKYYQNVLLRCQYLAKFIQYAQEKFPFIFLPNPKIDRSFPHFPAIRVFKYHKQKYIFVKDLEFALINYENVKIKVETMEERKNGIISTIEYNEFKNILNKTGITENDLNISKFMLKHVDYVTIRNQYCKRENPLRSIITPISKVDNKNILQLPRFFNKLDAHRIKFLDEYTYSMTTLFCDSYYENDTCLKLALNKTIQDESVKSKIISLVYEAEIRKFENQKRSVFYLTEEELYAFCETTNRRFDEVIGEHSCDHIVDFDLESCATEAEKRREIRKIWKTHFPINQYSYKFHDAVQEISKNEENREELITVGLKARRIFEEFAEKIRNFKDYCRDHEGRPIVMRTMCEMRIDSVEEWHMFSEEVLEAIEIVLENEGRLETMKDQIEKWRQKWNEGDNFSIITVKLFKTILNVVGIEPSKFIFMPDIQFFRDYLKLPLKMGYNAMKVLSPDGREVYHQVQAQFLIFQYGACDVLWDSDDKKAKNKHKKHVIEEIMKIGKGYSLAETVEESARRVMASDVTQKTPLSALHGKYYDEDLTKKEIQNFNKFLPHTKLVDIASYQCKAVLMVQTLDKFLKNSSNKVVMKNIHKAFSMAFGFVYYGFYGSFDKIYELGLKEGFQATIHSMINMASEKFRSQNMGRKGKKDEEENYLLSHLIKIVETGNIKNESARPTYNAKELIEQHYLFDKNDPLGTYAKEKKGNQRGRNFEIRKTMVEEEVIMMKVMNLIPKAFDSLSDEVFEPIDKLLEVFEDYIQKEFDEEEAVILCKGLKTIRSSDTLKTKLCENLDVTNNDKIEMYKRKKVEDPEKKVKTKREETPKVVVKYVTETKTVENCINCRNIEKETMDFMKKIERLEKENEEFQKIIRQNEEDLGMLKSQISQNKLKYREEIQKHKEDVESREARVEQLNQEIKEYRDDSRIERETLYAEVRASSRKADEVVKKMKIELENSKFLERAKNKQVDELAAENRQLKTSLEIAKENLELSEKAREEAEKQVKLLEKQIEEMSNFLEDCTSKEDLCLDSDPNIGPFEEILRFDVYEILKKISQISEKNGISKSEIARFIRKYDMYIRIVENENCWEKAEIPDFPIPFSMDFMQKYENCLKGNAE